jgi:hypothetical protein
MDPDAAIPPEKAHAKFAIPNPNTSWCKSDGRPVFRADARALAVPSIIIKTAKASAGEKSAESF